MATSEVFSQHGARLALNWLINSGTQTRPTNLYLAILSQVPRNDDGTGEGDGDSGTGGVVEFTSYTINPPTNTANTRPEIQFSAAAAVTSGALNGLAQQVQNSNAPAFTISASGTIRGIAICTASSNSTALSASSFQAGGNVIWFGELTSSVSVANGNTLTFSANQVTITLA